MKPMTNLDDATLMAFADGEVSAELAAAITQAMIDDPSVADRVKTHRRIAAQVAVAYGDIMRASVPEQHLSLFAKPRPTRSVTCTARAAKGFAVGPRTWMKLAATLALGIVVGQFVSPVATPQPIKLDRGRMLASADLAKGLSSVAGGNTANGGLRLGFSFNTDKTVCRTFRLEDAHPVAGLACREGKQWVVRAMAEAPPHIDAELKTASNDLPMAILAIVDETIVGEALTNDFEQQAMSSDWQRRSTSR